MGEADNTPRNVQIVFETWCAHANKNVNTRLNDARRHLIQKALLDYDLETVLDAVVGWKYSSHHSGNNDRNTIYNNLELLLRGVKIESFAEYTRTARAKGIAPPVSDLVRFVGEDDKDHPIIMRGPGYQGIGLFSTCGRWTPK